MKKQYYSTFIPGMERAVGDFLSHEGGVTVDRVMPGAALYRSVREPNFPYMHHTFMVLTQFSGVKDLDTAVKRLLMQGEWLDKMPYDSLTGKKFRIVTMQNGQLQSVNMRYLNMLEKAIMDHTGMRTLRERPEVELWIECRSPGVMYFLWRMGAKRGAKAPGQGALREDFCAMIAGMCRAGGQNIVNLCCREENIVRAQQRSGAKSIYAVCDQERIEKSLSGIKGVRTTRDVSVIEDKWAQAVVASVSDRIAQPQPEAFLRSLFVNAHRVMKDEGTMLLVALAGQADNAVSRAPQMRITGRYDLTLSGKKHVVWFMKKADEDTDEEAEA